MGKGRINYRMQRVLNLRMNENREPRTEKREERTIRIRYPLFYVLTYIIHTSRTRIFGKVVLAVSVIHFSFILMAKSRDGKALLVAELCRFYRIYFWQLKTYELISQLIKQFLMVSEEKN